MEGRKKHAKEKLEVYPVKDQDELKVYGEEIK